MKKLFSLFLLLSIVACSCNTSVLAATDNATEQNGVAQEQKNSEKKPAPKKKLALKNMRTAVKTNPVSEKLKKILKPVAITGAALGFVAGTTYLTYKACDKIGLISEVKTVFECIGKTKALKNLLIGYVGANVLGLFVTFYLIYKYGHDFLEAQVIAMCILPQIRQANKA